MARASAANVVGKLVLILHKGADLYDVDTFGKQDPYLIVKCGPHVHRTPVHKDAGSAPEWNDMAVFQLDGRESHVHLDVMDKDMISADDLIGTADIEFSRLLRHVNVPQWYAIVRKGNLSAGKIQITAKFEGTVEGRAFVADAENKLHVHEFPGPELKEKEVESHTDPSLYLALAPLSGPMLSLSVSMTWNDQGHGDRKGRMTVRLKRGVDPVAKVVAEADPFGLAPHEPASVTHEFTDHAVVTASETGDVIEFWHEIGAGHSLSIKNFKATVRA